MADNIAIGIEIDARKTKTGAKEAKDNIKGVREETEKLGKSAKSTSERDLSSLTKQLESLKQWGAAAGTGLSLATAAILATTAAALALSKVVFDLSKAFADYADQIGRAHEITGLSTEMLSALRFQSDKTGDSFDHIGTAINAYTKTIADAGNSSREAAAKLVRLGVDGKKAVGDLNGAFREVIQKILSLPAGVQQLAAATDAFGEMGPKLLPFFKSFNGNIDALIKKADEFGLVLSGKDVQAAKEFEESLFNLQARIKGVAFAFGGELMPEVERVISAMDNKIEGNKSTIEKWAEDAGAHTHRLITIFGDFITNLQKIEAGTHRLSEEWALLKTSIVVAMPSLIVAAALFDRWARSAAIITEKGRSEINAAGFKASVSAGLDIGYLSQVTAEQKQTEKLKELVRDLGLNVRFFGDESREAATKQQLLKMEIGGTNQGLANQALGLARTLDQMTVNAEQQEKYNETLKKASESLQKMREVADFERTFAKPTEIDRFNQWLKTNKVAATELKNEIQATRNELLLLQRVQNARGRDQTQRGVFDDITTAIKQLESVEVDEVTTKLKELAQLLGLKGYSDMSAAYGSIDATDSVFAERIKSFVANIRLLNQEGLPTEKIREKFQEFLASFKDDQGLQHLTDDKIPDLINLFLRLGTAAETAARRTAAALGADLIADLDAEIHSLNVELGISAELSRADAVAKILQGKAYQDLRPEIVATIKAQAAEADQLREAVKAQAEAQRQWDETYNTIRDSLGVLAEQGFGAFFKNVARKFQDFLLDMAAQWLTSKFFQMFFKGGNQQAAGSAGSGGFNIIGAIKQMLTGGGPGQGPGGTPMYNGNNFAGGESAANAAGMRPDFQTLGGHSSTSGDKNARLLGGLALAGVGANIVGGMIGGRWGNVISMAGTGLGIGATIGSMIAPGIGTAIGAVIGAAAGFLGGLFMGDPKRKRDKNEKIPALNRGFTDSLAELRALVADVRTLRVSPDSAIARATELRNQIASGFGLQFESSKYQKEARKLIQSRLAEADTLIVELRKVAEISNAASERERRLIPEFASGVFMSRDFARQYTDFRQRNGMLPGTFAGRDTMPSMLAPGEMVLNPSQQSRVRSNAGVDPFVNAGIPGYAGGRGGEEASPSPIGNITFVFEHSIDAEGMVRTQLKNSSVVKQELKIQIEEKFRNDEISTRRRGV